MPPTKRENLKRRCRQCDGGLRKAQQHLASIYVTIHMQHPELTERLFGIMVQVECVRLAMLAFYQDVWGGTEEGLWNEQDLGIILRSAKPVWDPNRDKET